MTIHRVAAIIALLWSSTLAMAQSQPIVLQAGTVLDGKGDVLHNAQIIVQHGRILRVEQNAHAAATYDLRKLTLMPGWIDVHDHITWHFGPNGHMDDPSETPEQATLAIAENAYATLMAGFTTIQSLGSPEDKDLRSPPRAKPCQDRESLLR